MSRRARSAPSPLVLQPPPWLNNNFTTPTQLGFDSLGLHSAKTPSQYVISSTNTPVRAASHGNSSFKVKTKDDTIFCKYGFFEDFPREVRDMIYAYLLGIVTVTLDNAATKPVSVRKSADFWSVRVYTVMHTGYRPRRYGHSVQKIPQNFLPVNKQFFQELRQILWRQMSLVIQRRWDALNLFMTGLPPRTPIHSPPGAPHLTLFPAKMSIATFIRSLKIDLCQSSDFEGRVTTSEARRVTESIMEFIHSNMPRLTELTFILDHRSRVSSSVSCFLPDAWFLKGILKLKGLDPLRLQPGSALWGRSSARKTSLIYSIRALDAVLNSFLMQSGGTQSFSIDQTSDRQLQLSVARAMLVQMQTNIMSWEAYDSLATRIAIMQSCS